MEIFKPQSTRPVDISGTITAGGAAQTLAAKRKGRSGFWLQNLSAGDLWVSEMGDAAATQPSWKIQPGQLYETPASGCPEGELSIFGATTGQAFAAREW